MSLSLSLVTFSPNTTVKSSDINSNFQQILNATKFYGSQGAVNNIFVTISIQDIDIYVENGSRHVRCGSHDYDDACPDRGYGVSVKKNGNKNQAICIDLDATFHFVGTFPKDKFGNKMIGSSYFNGFGSGYVSHGYVGCNPLTVMLTVHNSTPASISYTSLGSSTVNVHTSSNVSWDGLAFYYE